MNRRFPKARWLLHVQQLRANVAEQDALRDADRELLLRVLDAVLVGKDAESIGRGVLDVFGVARSGGRPVDESEALKADYAWNAHRVGVPIDTIASTTGWTAEAVRRFLDVHGAADTGDPAARQAE